MTNQPTAPGLYLFVRSEPIERELTGLCTCNPHDLVYWGCKCDKTGKRKRTVVVQGWVEVTGAYTTFEGLTLLAGELYKQGKSIEAWGNTFPQAKKALNDAIIAAYLAGTLPAEIADGLEEVEVDE